MNRPNHRDIAALNYARLLGMEAVFMGDHMYRSQDYWTCCHGDGKRNLSSWTEHGLAWLYLIHFHVGIDAEGNAYDNRELHRVQREARSNAAVEELAPRDAGRP